MHCMNVNISIPFCISPLSEKCECFCFYWNTLYVSVRHTMSREDITESHNDPLLWLEFSRLLTKTRKREKKGTWLNWRYLSRHTCTCRDGEEGWMEQTVDWTSPWQRGGGGRRCQWQIRTVRVNWQVRNTRRRRPAAGNIWSADRLETQASFAAYKTEAAVSVSTKPPPSAAAAASARDPEPERKPSQRRWVARGGGGHRCWPGVLLPAALFYLSLKCFVLTNGRVDYGKELSN